MSNDTPAEVWVEVSGRRAALFARAPESRELILEPRLAVEDDAGARLAVATLPPQQDAPGPAGSVVVPAGQDRKLATWTGEVDLPAIQGPSPTAILVETGPKEPGAGEERASAPPGRYGLRLFSFLDGEPLASAAAFELPPATGGISILDAGQDDASFVKAFLAEAREVGEECWLRPGRWEEAELEEMARLADLDAIPSLHRELLLRVRRLRIADHDLVTPPSAEEDLEVVRVHARERELFPWFSQKPYDRGEFICFDLESGALVQTRQLRVEPLGQSPRGYLVELLRRARER
jgi:hypothetical protein